MERRNFFKLVGTASGAAVTGACGKASRELIPLLVPEKEIVPGEEMWHPGVCRECEAGCGVIVRVMEAERQVETAEGKVRERIAAVKKIEGNPLDSVSGGRLCARGQAAVQSLYHPDRLRGPLARTGKRGEAGFTPVSWEEALDRAASLLRKVGDPSRIIWLGRPLSGTRSATVASFLAALGAPQAATAGVCDHTIERKAADAAFGWSGLPVYELQDADFALGLGADFLGGWVSPVFYSRRFGHMRQGRPGRRGRLVHAESRFSVTAAAADEWLPVRPGGEHALALALGYTLVTEKLARRAEATSRLSDAFASTDFQRAAEIAGLPAERIRDVARRLGAAEHAVVVAGASIAQANSLDAVVAGCALNWLLGAVNRRGGVRPPAAPADTRPAFDDVLSRLKSAELVFLDGANPAYALPASVELLAATPSVVSFSAFLDDSAAFADLILPDHSWLESEAAAMPPVSPGVALAGAPAFIRPLHGTRRTEETLDALAKALGKPIDVETPARVFERLYESAKPAGDWENAADFASFCQRQGGWWEEPAAPVTSPARELSSLPPVNEAEFTGDPSAFPLYFQPYPSTQFGDGSGANLPWMQELPDPVSSAMWGLPLEVDLGTARALGVLNGDIVRVVSPRGQLEAPVYVHPAARPGVASMAIGQGHEHYTRYASGRGANPLTIAVPVPVKGCGVFAFGATRIRLEKTGRRGGLVQFSTTDRAPEARRT
ncbi:MAG: molybdopterin-dependent oxidoreductase [Bryobacteraceae bacterium]|nr:molybdopterin-dependent oxidoreductase [Bryobacteraceae bacterium]